MRFRIVLYDSPEHGRAYFEDVVERAVGLPAPDAAALTTRIVDFDFQAGHWMSDRGTAQEAFEQILAAGRDPTVDGSKGSLVAAIEEVHEDGGVLVVRRGRAVNGQFVSMSRDAVAEFMGAPLDDWPYGDPLLVVRGEPLRSVHIATLLVLTPGLALASTIALSTGAFPWLYSGAGAPSPFAVLAVLAVPFGSLLYCAALWVARPRRSASTTS